MSCQNKPDQKKVKRDGFSEYKNFERELILDCHTQDPAVRIITYQGTNENTGNSLAKGEFRLQRGKLTYKTGFSFTKRESWIANGTLGLLFTNFISSVVVVGMVVTFLSPSTGLINNILARFGMERVNFLTEPSYFWIIYTIMTIWQTAGYSAIIYLASLTGISSELYEAARIDGAGRWAQLLHITLPGLTPTIVLLFLMKIGRVLDVGYETIVLMYNPSIYSTADVIGTYVYRRGILNGEYSFASAVGFFQSVIGLLLVLFANRVAKKTSETSLW